jgi:hypothetical protein
VTFSYDDFLAKISLSLSRGTTRQESTPKRQHTAPGANAPAFAAFNGAGAAADSLQLEAAHLPGAEELGRDPRHADGESQASRLAVLLDSLWKMTDDLAMIREEFRGHASQKGRAAPASHAPAPPGGYRLDEADGVIAQVNAVEHSLIAIVAVLTGRDGSEPTAENTQDFLRRVAQQKAEVFRNSATALNQLRLQAIQLAASVHDFRSSLAMAGKVIARAQR